MTHTQPTQIHTLFENYHRQECLPTSKSDATITKSKTKCANFFFLPLGGQGNLYSACPSASCMTRESFALPSHPECTYINCMLKLHAHITFWVMSFRLSLNVVFLPNGAEALMCVPSITPTHFCYKNR